MNIVFDKEAFAEGLIQAIIAETDNCIKVFVNEVKQGLSEGKDAIEIEAAEQVGADRITATAKFYADAILESYGTGSKADTGPYSYWDEYARSWDFNELRTGTAIVGRPRGSYVDPWGEQHSTWGQLAGQNLEGRTFIDEYGNEVTIEPKAPTYAIQNAEKWIVDKTNTWIERRLSVAITQWISENASKYFHN